MDKEKFAQGGGRVFSGFGREMIAFFLDLRFHNNKAFMDANRDRYLKDVRMPFYAFIQEMGPLMQTIDQDMEIRPNKCLSRINRDIRFSRDKSPYRDHLWVAFRQAAVNKDGMPFYWFEISPEHVTWGLGVWSENRNLMDAMRRKMEARPEDFSRLLPVLRDRGFALSGRAWKKIAIPETIPEELRPWYRKRDIYAEKLDVPLDVIFSSDLCDRVGRDYRALAPLYHIFRGCVEEAMNQMDDEGGNV